MKPRHRYANQPEQSFKEFADKFGWEITKRGWPDFLVRLPSGEFVVVEVKPNSGGRPKKEQKLILEWLTSLGVRSFVWRPDTKFDPVVIQ